MASSKLIKFFLKLCTIIFVLFAQEFQLDKLNLTNNLINLTWSWKSHLLKHFFLLKSKTYIKKKRCCPTLNLLPILFFSIILLFVIFLQVFWLWTNFTDCLVKKKNPTFFLTAIKSTKLCDRFINFLDSFINFFDATGASYYQIWRFLFAVNWQYLHEKVEIIEFKEHVKKLRF